MVSLDMPRLFLTGSFIYCFSSKNNNTIKNASITGVNC